MRAGNRFATQIASDTFDHPGTGSPSHRHVKSPTSVKACIYCPPPRPLARSRKGQCECSRLARAGRCDDSTALHLLDRSTEIRSWTSPVSARWLVERRWSKGARGWGFRPPSARPRGSSMGRWAHDDGTARRAANEAGNLDWVLDHHQPCRLPSRHMTCGFWKPRKTWGWAD